VRRAFFVIFLLTLCGTFSTAPGQSLHASGVNNAVLSQIPQRIKHFIDEQAVAGAVTLVASGSDIVEFDALGMADIEAGHPMQKDTIFQGVSKPL
jgi:CubicO group peptidase (beta-lactamase class C family)